MRKHFREVTGKKITKTEIWILLEVIIGHVTRIRTKMEAEKKYLFCDSLRLHETWMIISARHKLLCKLERILSYLFILFCVSACSAHVAVISACAV